MSIVAIVRRQRRWVVLAIVSGFMLALASLETLEPIRPSASWSIDGTPEYIGSPDIPAWFGSPGPHRRISGQVIFHGRREPVRLHLRLDIPDPRYWNGLDLTLGADGRFDFGELPQGKYQLLAMSRRTASRVVHVDTSATLATDLRIHVHPCHVVRSRVVRGTADWSEYPSGPAISRAEVELGGVRLAPTGENGEIEVCLPSEFARLSIRARGLAVSHFVFHPWHSRGDRPVVLRPERVLVGRVIREDGSSAVGVTLEPFESGGTPRRIDAMGVSDDSGTFVIRGADHGATSLRITERGIAHDGHLSTGDVIVLPPTDRRRAGNPGVHPRPPWAVELRGRVLHHGAPVEDAFVCGCRGPRVRCLAARTDRNGEFILVFSDGHSVLVHVEHGLSGLEAHRTWTLKPDNTTHELVIEAQPR